MRKAFRKLTTAIGNLIQKLIESIIFRISFFIIFALTVSNVLAGGIMMILYQTSLKDRLNITPLKLTIIVLVFSYLSSAVLSIVINRNVFKPLRKLTKLTEQVAKGNYDVDVNGITNIFTEKYQNDKKHTKQNSADNNCNFVKTGAYSFFIAEKNTCHNLKQDSKNQSQPKYSCCNISQRCN